MQNKLFIFKLCLLYNIMKVRAEPSNRSNLYITTTIISCIIYAIVIFMIKRIIQVYKNKRSSKNDKHINSITSSDISSMSLVGRYENVKEIESLVPPCLKAYVNQHQWTELVTSIKLNNSHRNSFFSFHPLLFPVVSGVVKFCQYIIHNNAWSSYLNEKVVNNASISELREIETKYGENVGDNVISKLCIILVIEDILCFIMYYWFSKYMVKKNHTTYTSRFIQANETLKNENIPLVWVLDWKPPEYTLFGFSEICYIELHLLEEENVIVIK